MRRVPFHIVLVLMTAAGCSRTVDNPHVARIGDRLITVEEFVLNYEFGFSHLKQGKNPRHAYLQRMIDEKLLALEGYRLGLDRLPAVESRLSSLREKLLVEAVFERDVNARIEVTDDDVRGLMQRDLVRFKLRYVPAATRDEAVRLRQLVSESGFDSVLEEFLGSETGSAYRPADFESPFVRWHDISPALMDAVERLPIGEISEPVAYRGSYLLLQVMDVRRDPVTSVSDPSEIERYRQIAFQRKAKEKARDYIGQKMKPLNLRLKGPVFLRLSRHLWSLYQDSRPTFDLITIVEASNGAAGDSVGAMLDEILFTTHDRIWSVADFLREYPLDRYPLATQSDVEFSTDLYDAVGLTLRDRAFVKEGDASDLDEAPTFKAEYQRWADKWVFRETVRHLRDSTSASLEAYLESLRTRYDVHINESVLDTLNLSRMRGPADPNVMLLERHSGQPAIPIVDPWWGGSSESEGDR